MKNKNVCFSLVLLAIAAVIALSSLGCLGGLHTGTIVFLAIMAVISLASLSKLWFGGFLFPIAILYLKYGNTLGLVSLGRWETIAITLCVSLALDILFDPLRKRFFENHKPESHHDKHSKTVQGTENEDFFYEKANFCSKIRYVNSRQLSGGKIDCTLASMKVYFDKVDVPAGKCSLDIECHLGTVELFIPANWAVEYHIERTLGNIEDTPYDLSHGTPAVTLLLDGDLSLGTIQINRI